MSYDGCQYSDYTILEKNSSVAFRSSFDKRKLGYFQCRNTHLRVHERTVSIWTSGKELALDLPQTCLPWMSKRRWSRHVDRHCKTQAVQLTTRFTRSFQNINRARSSWHVNKKAQSHGCWNDNRCPATNDAPELLTVRTCSEMTSLADLISVNLRCIKGVILK